MRIVRIQEALGMDTVTPSDILQQQSSLLSSLTCKQRTGKSNTASLGQNVIAELDMATNNNTKRGGITLYCKVLIRYQHITLSQSTQNASKSHFRRIALHFTPYLLTKRGKGQTHLKSYLCGDHDDWVHQERHGGTCETLFSLRKTALNRRSKGDDRINSCWYLQHSNLKRR